jgi:hypothetical protein
VRIRASGFRLQRVMSRDHREPRTVANQLRSAFPKPGSTLASRTEHSDSSGRWDSYAFRSDLSAPTPDGSGHSTTSDKCTLSIVIEPRPGTRRAREAATARRMFCRRPRLHSRHIPRCNVPVSVWTGPAPRRARRGERGPHRISCGAIGAPPRCVPPQLVSSGFHRWGMSSSMELSGSRPSRRSTSVRYVIGSMRARLQHAVSV